MGRVQKILNEYGLEDIWTYDDNGRLLCVDIAYPKGYFSAKKSNKKKLKKDMTEKEQIFNDIQDLFNQFVEAHNGTSKASSREARKLLGEIKKLVTPYRKASVDADKK